MASSHARTESKKLQFLKAFKRERTISGAAKAARISREQVHRWLNSDESFARLYEVSRSKKDRDEFQSFETAIQFFSQIVRPVVPPLLWPRITAELGLALANLRNDLKGAPQRGTPSGKTAQSFILHGRHGGVAVSGRSMNGFVDDL